MQLFTYACRKVSAGRMKLFGFKTSVYELKQRSFNLRNQRYRKTNACVYFFKKYSNEEARIVKMSHGHLRYRRILLILI